jgi:hypothetical protein
MQGSIFIGVQATGLHSLFVHDCEAMSQIIWPGMLDHGEQAELQS